MRSVFAFLALFLTACGYTFIGAGSALPVDVRKIYIPVVENETTEHALTMTMTEALQDRFERYGVISVVDSLSEADAVLNAKILSVEQDTETSTSGTDVALQYSVTMSISAELRRVSGPVLWRNNNLSASQLFGATSDVVVKSSADFSSSSLSADDLSRMNSREVARVQESEALDMMAEKIAKMVYNQAVAPEF